MSDKWLQLTQPGGNSIAIRASDIIALAESPTLSDYKTIIITRAFNHNLEYVKETTKEILDAIT